MIKLQLLQLRYSLRLTFMIYANIIFENDVLHVI
jgi:hypothetical protein